MMEQKSPKRLAAEARLKKNQEDLKRLGRLFHRGDGKQLLDILKEMYYDVDLIAETTEKTYVKLGAREVVRYLMDLATKE